MKNTILILESDQMIRLSLNEKRYTLSGFSEILKEMLLLSLCPDLEWRVFACDSFKYDRTHSFFKEKVEELELRQLPGIFIVWPGYSELLKNNLGDSFGKSLFLTLEEIMKGDNSCHLSIIQDGAHSYYTLSNFKKMNTHHDVEGGGENLLHNPSLN